jgi:hypothetical protein
METHLHHAASKRLKWWDANIIRCSPTHSRFRNVSLECISKEVNKVLLIAILLGGLCFAAGWVLKDYKWTSAAKKGKVMVVDGDLYDVKRHTETHGGSVEE